MYKRQVLIVDNVNEQQERFLKNNLHRVRRAEDPFIYEPVIVPSLEDALMGILFNHNVQAVIVRPGLVLKSKNVLPIIQQYLKRFNEMEEVDALEPYEYGPEACRLIAKVRPELDAYLITDRSAEDIAGLDLGRCQPSGAERADQGSAGHGGTGLWLEADLLRHQRYLDLQ